MYTLGPRTCLFIYFSNYIDIQDDDKIMTMKITIQFKIETLTNLIDNFYSIKNPL